MNEALNKNLEKNELIDNIQGAMGKLPQVDVRPIHTFLPGLYIREIMMPAGTIAVSKIHKTTHPVFICGKMDVYNVLYDKVTSVDGYWKGVTEPGTRRVFKVIEDTVLTTVHSVASVTGEENAWSDIEKEALALEIEKIIIEPHDIMVLNETEVKEWLS